MAWNKIKHVVVAGLAALGLTTATSGEAKAAEPTTPSLAQRIDAVRGQLANVDASAATGKSTDLREALQRAWGNCWNNWGNWGNWGNWCNWNNWRNWANWANHWCNW